MLKSIKVELWSDCVRDDSEATFNRFCGQGSTRLGSTQASEWVRSKTGSNSIWGAALWDRLHMRTEWSQPWAGEYMDTPPPQVGVDCGDWCAALLLSSELLFLLVANCGSDFQSSQDSLPDSVGWRSLRSEIGACEPGHTVWVALLAAKRGHLWQDSRPTMGMLVLNNSSAHDPLQWHCLRKKDRGEASCLHASVRDWALH